MSHQAVILHFLCVFGAFQTGLTSLVETQHTVMAAVGDRACLNCQLMQSKDVLQVTWQKLLPEGEKNVATYNKYFGQRVNAAFQGNMEFEAAGLQNSSIVIRKVTEQDEGCYRCLFNCYPEGALTGTTCLQLYELHEPVLHVGESNSAEEPLVSCSATGRPAPTVTLCVLPHKGHFSNHSSVRVTNTNGTVTVTTTAVLSRLHDNSTQVGCAARVPFAPQIEVLVMIPEVKQSSAAGSDEEHESDRGRSWTSFCIIAPFMVVCCAAAVIAILPKQKYQSSRTQRGSEMIEMHQTTNRDAHEAEEPLVTQENHQFSQKTSPVKSQESDNSDPSPLIERKPEMQLTPEKNLTSDTVASSPARKLLFD